MDENLMLVWEKCLQFMRDNLNAAEDNTDLKKLENSFDLLFDNVQPISLVSNNLTLLVPSDFYKEYIEDNYLSLLWQKWKSRALNSPWILFMITSALQQGVIICSFSTEKNEINLKKTAAPHYGITNAIQSETEIMIQDTK